MNSQFIRPWRCGVLCAVGVWLFAAAIHAEDAVGPRMATFRCDVTPPLGQPIYSSYKPLAVVEHPLLAKGIVLEDGQRRYVLCALDWCEVCNGTHLLFRTKMAAAAGTDASCVAVQTVHQHTAPMGDGDASRLLAALNSPPPHPEAKFFDEVADRLAAAVKEAVGRLQPFDTIGAGQAKVARVASTRRIPTGDGELLTRMSSCKDLALRARPEGRIDPLVKTVTFAQGEKPLVRLHYYATHPQSFYGDPRASYDFPGMAREALEQKEKVPQIYFTGCGGDVAAGKYNDGSPQARDELAQRLLAGMEASIAATKLAPAGRIEWRTVPLPITPRSDAGYTVSDNRTRMEDAKTAVVQRVYAGAMRLAFLQRVEQPLILQSLQLGDLYILNLPGEAMIEYQLFAQQQRPPAFVAVAAYGDCGCGYVCTEKSFSEGGYEPTEAMLAPNSETAVKAAIRQLLGLGPRRQ